MTLSYRCVVVIWGHTVIASMKTLLGFPKLIVPGVYSYIRFMNCTEDWMTQNISVQRLIKQCQANCSSAAMSGFCPWQHVPITAHPDIKENNDIVVWANSVQHVNTSILILWRKKKGDKMRFRMGMFKQAIHFAVCVVKLSWSAGLGIAMENDRSFPLLMTMWFQHPAYTTISGWQHSKICILFLY